MEGAQPHVLGGNPDLLLHAACAAVGVLLSDNTVSVSAPSIVFGNNRLFVLGALRATRPKGVWTR